MKILIALSRFPYPLDKGDKLRAYYQIRDLSKHNDIYLVCLNESTPSEKDILEINKYCKKLFLVRINFFSKILNLISGIFNELPFQVNYFKSDKMRKVIEDVVAQEKIDVCYVQLVRLMNNIPFGLSTKYYLDYMDALSKGMRNRYPLSKWYEKLFVKLEYKRLLKAEAVASEIFHGFSIISESDLKELPVHISGKVDVISNGVNETFFDTEKLAFKDKEFDIIFTGNMGYHPNVQACKYIVRNILPLLKEKKRDIKICFAGVNASSEVLALQSPNVIVTGYIEDMRSYLQKSRLFVAPMFSGSGLQNKLLEAMAATIPVITTSLANKALMADPDKDVIVSDTEESFTFEILGLLQNEQKALTIGNNGKEFVKSNYNWIRCNADLEDALKRVVEKEYKIYTR